MLLNRERRMKYWRIAGFISTIIIALITLTTC
jgi:hypothetical protein